MPNKIIIGERVKELLHAHKMTCAEATNKAGHPVTISHLKEIVSHTTSHPHDAIVQRIAKALDTDVPYLRGDTPHAGSAQARLVRYRLEQKAKEETATGTPGDTPQTPPGWQPAPQAWQTMPTLGERLRCLRNGQNGTLKTVAALLDIDDSTVARQESNKLIPNAVEIAGYCQLYGIDRGDLLNGLDVVIPDTVRRRMAKPQPVGGASSTTVANATVTSTTVEKPSQFIPCIPGGAPTSVTEVVIVETPDTAPVSLDPDDELLATIKALRGKVRTLEERVAAHEESGRIMHQQASEQQVKLSDAGGRIGELTREVERLTKLLGDEERRAGNLSRDLEDARGRLRDAETAVRQTKEKASPPPHGTVRNAGGTLVWEDEQWSIPITVGIMVRRDFRSSVDPICMVWHPVAQGSSEPLKLHGVGARGFYAVYEKYISGGYNDLQVGETR